MLKNAISLVSVVILAVAVGMGATKFVLPLFEKEAVIVEKGDYSRYYADAGQDIVLFGTSTCPFCTKLRKLLAELNVNYSDYNLDTNKEAYALFEELDSESVPVLLIGNTRINGFSEVDVIKTLREYKQNPNYSKKNG